MEYKRKGLLEINQAPGAKTNTKYTIIDGQREIKGKPQLIPLTVMFTSDDFGETISIIDEYGKIRLTVPYEDAQMLIDETRRSGRQK